MNTKFEKFLLDNESNDQLFDKSYIGKLKIHKEKYDDRFVIIYIKHHREDLEQQDYTVGGYFDIKEKVLYDCDYWLRDVIPKDSLIEVSSFLDLGTKIYNEIKDYIFNYSFKHSNTLKEIAMEKFNNTEDYIKNSYKKNVRELFIAELNPTIALGKGYYESEVMNRDEYRGKNLYIKYLNNPKKMVEKISKELIERYKESLGLELLIYEYKIDYLNQIQNNESHDFDNLYINKNMYNSIKDIDAKTLNLTIHYGAKNMTFKYDYHTLIRDLLNDDRGSDSWGVAYDKVSDFIKENTNNTNSRGTEEFLFSNVTSITYGKKQLYHCDYPYQEIDLEESFDLEK